MCHPLLSALQLLGSITSCCSPTRERAAEIEPIQFLVGDYMFTHDSSPHMTIISSVIEVKLVNWSQQNAPHDPFWACSEIGIDCADIQRTLLRWFWRQNIHVRRGAAGFKLPTFHTLLSQFPPYFCWLCLFVLFRLQIMVQCCIIFPNFSHFLFPPRLPASDLLPLFLPDPYPPVSLHMYQRQSPSFKLTRFSCTDFNYRYI